MEIYDDLVIEAYIMAKDLLEAYREDGYAMYMYALLVGAYPIKAHPDSEHNYHAVIDAVHIYYKEKDDREDMKEFYIEGLKYLAEKGVERSVVHKAISIFNYEITIEQKGRNAFTVDMKMISKLFKKSLKKNIKRYEEEETGFSNRLKERSDYAKKNYGYSFW